MNICLIMSRRSEQVDSRHREGTTQMLLCEQSYIKYKKKKKKKKNFCCFFIFIASSFLGAEVGK